MQNPSNASDAPFDRTEIARDLYLNRGAADASRRCDMNSQLGDFDLLQTLIERMGPAEGRTVYDVGCGSGQQLAAFAATVGPEGRAIGFDISPQAVERAKDRGVEAHVADLAEIPMPDGSADAIVCSYAIYYHADLEAVVREWNRLLRPGGKVIVAGPAFGANEELYAFHRRATGEGPSDSDLMALGYVETQVARALGEAGFNGVNVETFVNRMNYPTRQTFLEYWKSTSLYARTVADSQIWDEAALDSLEEPVRLTKRIAILTATKG